MNLEKASLKIMLSLFLGGGALFFALSQRYKIESAYLSDLNKDLILTYQVIQQRPNDLLDFLEQYQKDYDQTEPEKRKDLFLTVRRHFNLQHFEINYKNCQTTGFHGLHNLSS